MNDPLQEQAPSTSRLKIIVITITILGLTCLPHLPSFVACLTGSDLGSYREPSLRCWRSTQRGIVSLAVTG